MFGWFLKLEEQSEDGRGNLIMKKVLPTYTLEKSFTFEAAHQLPEHDGKCQRLHGHSWRMTVIVRGHQVSSEGPKTGMVMDYGDIPAVVKPLVEEFLDHHFLNETLPIYPTSEMIAEWVYQQLKPQIPKLSAVVIEETCTARCIYSEDVS